MSLAISTIREAIRMYEGTQDPQWQEMWAEKIRGIGRDCPEAAPWAEAFEICVAYNAEQERACAAWKARREIELAAEMFDNVTPVLEERLSMRYAIVGAANCQTFTELAAMTPAERFAHGFIPRWLRSSWDYKGISGDARTRLDGQLA